MMLSDDAIAHLRQVVNLPDLSGTKYKMVRKIATGGMGSVYLVEDLPLHRQVALKIMNITDKDGDLAKRMTREAQIIAQLEHPGIVPVHDVGTLADGSVYYTMKYVQGTSLTHFVLNTGPLTDRLRVFQRICEAVAFAHANSVIHRDLKPENIMIGDFGEVLIMDWGIAKIVAGEELTRITTGKTEPGTAGKEPGSNRNKTDSGTVLGTPAYMSPEQANGEIDLVDKRSDIFSLGVILNFLVLQSTSQGQGQTVGMGKQKTSKLLRAIFIKAMSPERELRYQNVLDMSGDIDRFLAGLPVSAYYENPFESLWRWSKKNKFIIILVISYLLMRFLFFFFRGL